MTVKELIEALQKCPQERPVYIGDMEDYEYDIVLVYVDDIYPEVVLRPK